MQQFSCPNGSSASGYLAECKNARGALIVLQEWWGLNQQMKEVADRLAGVGFTALVPDLYHGRVTQNPDEAGHLMDGLDWVGATEQEVAGALAYLNAKKTPVAVMGYCMGGALTIIAGVKLEGLRACVCYYGIPPREQADPSLLKVALQGHFAQHDDWCTPHAVDELEQALSGSPLAHEIHRYDAKHGFFNHQEPEAYDAQSAERSWERTLQFLKTHLG